MTRWDVTADTAGAVRALEALTAKVQAGAAAGAAAAGAVVERAAKLELSRYSHPRGTRTTSPPGQPPAVVTGTLRRSVHFSRPETTGPGRFSVSVGPSVIYGRIQELGGNTGRGGATYLPPRPYLRPALEKSRPGIRAAVLAAVARSLR